MASLFVAKPSSPDPRLPSLIRETIVALMAEHPPLHLREIVTICYVRHGRKATIQPTKRVLAEAKPAAPERRHPLFHEIAHRSLAML